MKTRFCSAAIVYNKSGQVLLCTNKSQTKWLFPKGGVEPGLTPSESAAKECREEAGWSCSKQGFSLGTYEILKEGMINKVEVFALSAIGQVESLSASGQVELVSPEGRLVGWFSAKSAMDLLDQYQAVFVAKLAGHLTASAKHEKLKDTK